MDAITRARAPRVLYASDAVKRVVEKFEDAMNDDFNTAKALGDLSEIFKLINEILDQPRDADEDARTLNAIEVALNDVGGSLGLFQTEPAVLLAELESKKQKMRRLMRRGLMHWCRSVKMPVLLKTLRVPMKSGMSFKPWVSF